MCASSFNQLMMFRKTIIVYSENQTESTNTVLGENAEVLNIE
jgi:hypothetical protein